MSTIDPSTIDTSKPHAGEALTSDVRANEQATQANFQAAKNDIEGLESGKEDAGTAAAAVAAHDGDAGAHPGTFAPASHVTDTANPHATTVSQDASPELSGDLRSGGNDLVLTDLADAEIARLGFVSGTESAFFARVTDGVYDDRDGALILDTGTFEARGEAVVVAALKNATAGGQQVYVSEGGLLFGVDPPTPGWIESDTDTGSYDLGNGATPQAWVQMVGLVITVPLDVNTGDRIDVTYSIYAVNKTATRTGTIDIDATVDGAAPTGALANHVIVADYAGPVSGSLTIQAAAPITAGSTVSLWARISSADNLQFGVDLVGSVQTHTLTVSTPGQGGGGTPTSFTALTDTPSSYAGAAGQAAVVNGTETGLEFATPAGGGDVTGPAGVASANALAIYADTTGKVIADGTIVVSDVVTQATAFASTGLIPISDGTAKALQPSTYTIASLLSEAETQITSVTPATIAANEASVDMAKVGGALQKRKISGDLASGMEITSNVNAITFKVVAPVLFSSAGDVIDSTVGYAATNRDVAGAAVTPAPLGGQLLTLTDSDPVIAAPSTDGVVTYIIPSAVNSVDLTAYSTIKGARGSGVDSVLQIWKAGARSFAVWSD